MFNKPGVHHTGVHVKDVEMWGFMEIGKWTHNDLPYSLDIGIGSFMTESGVIGLSLFMFWGSAGSRPTVVWKGPISNGGKIFEVREDGNPEQQKIKAEAKMHAFFLMVFHGRDRIIQHLLKGRPVPDEFWKFNDRQ